MRVCMTTQSELALVQAASNIWPLKSLLARYFQAAAFVAACSSQCRAKTTSDQGLDLHRCKSCRRRQLCQNQPMVRACFVGSWPGTSLASTVCCQSVHNFARADPPASVAKRFLPTCVRNTPHLIYCLPQGELNPHTKGSRVATLSCRHCCGTTSLPLRFCFFGSRSRGRLFFLETTGRHLVLRVCFGPSRIRCRKRCTARLLPTATGGVPLEEVRQDI